MRESLGEQSRDIKANSDADFLPQAEPAVDHSIVLPIIDPRVLQIIANVSFTNLASYLFRKHLTASPTSARKARGCRGHVPGNLAPEGVEPAHARRCYPQTGSGTEPAEKNGFPGAGKFIENALPGLGHPK